MKRLMHTSALALSAALSAALTMALPAIATAQTIYPIDRADILAGSKFDFKVEFPGNPAQGDVKVLINGRDAAEVLGKPASFVAKEDGLDHSAYWTICCRCPWRRESIQSDMVRLRNANRAQGQKRYLVCW
jgi:hypothetical protein